MKKTVLTTLLTVGLLIPNGSVFAAETAEKPELDPALLYPGVSEIKTDEETGVTTAKGISAVVEAPPADLVPANRNINAVKGQGLTAEKPELDPALLAPATTKAPEKVGTKPETTKAVAAAKAKAKASTAKPGAKSLPKTSAVK